MQEVSLLQLAEYFHLDNLTEEIPLDSQYIRNTEINRPALQLTGFYQYFDNDRIQLMGHVENAYLQQKTLEERIGLFRELFARRIPCLVLCRAISLDDEVLAEAVRSHTPILRTSMPTTEFMGRLNQYLRTVLAPQVSAHGVLVDVYGVGVLITGESGIGKSETALELVRRGHRLVADDVVEIRKLSDDELVGSSPDVLRHFVELRGIGIVNVKEIFGVEAVKESQKIDMVIELEPWTADKVYDRVGSTNETREILGSEVVLYRIPIQPGRNLAVIIETATVNHRSRRLGYNAAEDLSESVARNIARRGRERAEREMRNQET